MKILVAYPAESPHRQRLAAAWPEAEFVEPESGRLTEQLAAVEIYCGHVKSPVDWPRVVAAGRLQWIQSSAAGLDHCLVGPIIQSPVVVTSASGVFAEAVAEHTLALLLGLLRQIPTFVRDQAVRRYQRIPTDDLRGKQVGILGLGGNGTRIAELLKVFRARILALDRFQPPSSTPIDRFYDATQLAEFLQECQILIVTLPLTDETRNLLGAEELGRLPAGALLINVGRGPLIDERALVEALRSGHVAAAGLDVQAEEPLPAASPLWDLPQVLVTPHVAAQSHDRWTRMTELFCENLERYRGGEPLWNAVDKSLGFPEPAARWPGPLGATRG